MSPPRTLIRVCVTLFRKAWATMLATSCATMLLKKIAKGAVEVPYTVYDIRKYVHQARL